MAGRTSVVELSGNYEESILQWAKHLGTNKIRRKLFDAVYGRGEKARSKKQLMQAAGIKSAGAQQAQNELDHLSKHYLIVRVENDGSVKDRSRYLYKKDPGVRANREKIVRYAENPSAASKVATKRRPLMREALPARGRITRQILRKRKRLNVLYLTANPDDTNVLRVDKEVKRVQEEIRGSKFRDNIEVQYRPAADFDSLFHGLNDFRPGIVHFSGHGHEDGIAFDHGDITKSQAKIVTFDLLGKALAATDNPPEVIVLSACKSAGAKKAFFPPAKAMIVMRESVSDSAAATFATKFYAAIAGGQPVSAAFEQGRVAVEFASIDEGNTPELVVAKGIDPAKLVLT
jgi:hypothetical protein